MFTFGVAVLYCDFILKKIITIIITSTKPILFWYCATVNMAVFILLGLCLLSVASQGVVGDKVYTVVANQSASSCPGNQTECSLMYYAAHLDEYFREDNTTFHFLPGHHQLVNSTLVLMANIANLTLYGTDVSKVKVVCSGENSGGLVFYNITNFSMRHLSFWNCSKRQHWSYDSLAVHIQQTLNIELDHINIQNTAGLGLSLKNVYGKISIYNITVDFSHSTQKSKGINFVFYCSYPYVSDSVLASHMKVSDSFFRYGNNVFDDSTPSSGIVVKVYCSANIHIIFDNVALIGNQGKNGGNAWINFGSWSSLWSASIAILNSQILNGTANSGGGLCVFAIAGGVNYRHTTLGNSTTILNVVNTHFEDNTAYHNGGAVFLRLTQNSQRDVGRIVFQNNCTFKQNKLLYHAELHGGIAVYVVTFTLPRYNQHSMMFFKVEFSDCNFLENYVIQKTTHPSSSIQRTGALYTENAQSITIHNCRFINNICSGIVGIYSNFLLHGENEIRGNSAPKGGGLYFCASSMMHLYNGTKLTIIENNATFTGGGIFVERECSPAVELCFFQVDNAAADNATLQQTQVHLINNIANAGSALYGGLIDVCTPYVKRGQKFNYSFPGRIFNSTFHIKNATIDLSVISSDAMYIGFCIINSSTTELTLDNCPLNTTVRVKPGKMFNVSAVIMGQRYGLVSGLVEANRDSKAFNISPREYSQYIDARNAKRLTYTLFSKESRNVSLKLVAEDYYSGFPPFQYQPSYINIIVEKCPLGFIEHSNKCSCLVHIPCNIVEQIIYRSKPHWIGYKECCIANTTSIILHSFCPLGYCLDQSISIEAEIDDFHQDVQCAEYRTGLLCGKCKQNYSLGFGSSQCLAGCNTAHRYLQYLRVIGLVAVCAVAGILLVVLLTLLNLTVAEGTLNGLIFYANIVHVNLDLFFPPDTHSRPWTAFIAWLNLDFGVTVCFYDGMDAYVKTWLQFIFPLYIWIISGGIVYFSRKSRRISKLAGKNSVKVLATLFLLSFGKLFRTVIAAGFFTNIKSYDGTIYISVWLLDANVRYLHGKHILLFVAASVAGVVALLYALILTYIQCLRRAPNSRMCGWVQRLKPLLDAYTGPYKNKYHFWTGLLLLVRIALFTAFAVNFENNPTLNFTLIIAVSTLLIIGIQKGIYRNKLIGLLESSMYANLILFSAFTMLSMNSDPTQKTAVVCVFGGWAFLTLVGIFLYHGYKNWFGNYLTRGYGRVVMQPLHVGRDGDVLEESDGDPETEQELQNHALVTPHLREPLIGGFSN